MLDRYTGFLFILGAGYALWRWRDPGHFLLLAWVVVTLQGGIWSVEFEAPQAYRTVGLTPAIAMLAALPLGLLWRLATEHSDGPSREPRMWPARLRPYSLVAVAALVTLFSLAQAGRINFDKYFNEQLTRADAWAAYSVDATIVAREMRALGTEPDYKLSTLLRGQPTLIFEDPDYVNSRVSSFDWVSDIPAPGDGPAAYFLDSTKEPLHRWLQVLYPDGRFQEFSPPNVPNPVVVYEAVIPGEAVRALRGLEAAYGSGDDIELAREAALDLDWSAGAPGELPLEAVWSGFLETPDYKDYQLTLDVPGSARLFLDGELVAEGSGRVAAARRLYKGEHELRVEARVERPGKILLSWDGSPVPSGAYFAYDLGGHGLLGSFYTNDNWEGEAALQELDPLVGFRYHAELPFASPFTVSWRGFLEVPMSGEYNFRMHAIDEAVLLIDGMQVLSDPYTLTEGRHAIEVRFRNLRGFAHMFLYWTPPGDEEEVIPPVWLSPR